MAMERFPKINRGIMADFRKIDDVAVFLGAVPDHARVSLIRAGEIDAEEQSMVDSKVSAADQLLGGIVVVQQGGLCVKTPERLVGDRGVSADESNLVQRLSGANFDGERAWDDLQEKPAS